MNTTIAAISTAVSASGIGIIRISGPEAMDVISRIYRSKGGKKKIKEVPTHTIHYGYIMMEKKRWMKFWSWLCAPPKRSQEKIPWRLTVTAVSMP